MLKAATFQRILIPFDGSAASSRAAQIAVGIAAALGGQVIFSYIAPELTSEEDAKRTLEPAVTLAEQAGLKFETHVIDGATDTTSQAIANDARNSTCDLIVMGTRGREGLARLLIGSVAEQVTRVAPVPVMLVRPVKDADRSAPRIARILVAVDGSRPSNLALQAANDLAHALGASLEVVSIIPDLPFTMGYAYSDGGYLPPFDDDRYASGLAANSQAILSSATQQLGHAALKPVSITTSSIPASGQRIAAAISLAAENIGADLIVIGTHGRGGIEELLLGSVAQGVMHHANIPVLLIRQNKLATVET